MTYRIHQIKLSMGQSIEQIPDKILKKIGNKDLIITDWKVVKESIDARNKTDIKLVYSVDFCAVYKREPKKHVWLAANPKLNLELAKETLYELPHPGNNAEKFEESPVVVGFGPAGMFAGLILAEAGYKPVILERGQDVDARSVAVQKFWNEGILDVNSNVQFGEGGAGTFSDGKLTTGIKDARIKKVLAEFVAAGAPEDILYKQKPHIGTDILRVVVKNIREKIKSLGGQVLFNARVDDIVLEKGKLVALDYFDLIAKERKTVPCQAAVFALGHSARDTFRWMNKRGIEMTQKPFSIGVRIEHPQDLIDTAQYGAPARELGLPAADYKLSYRCEDGRGVYTFCMCPGGEVVIASSQEGGVVTNGMSCHDRASGKANSALLCDVRTEDFDSDDVLAGVLFQEKYEKLAYENGGSCYKAPQTTWGNLREGKAPAVENSLPDFAVSAIKEAMTHLGQKLKGFDSEDAVMTAVETRSSSPVRVVRNAEYEGSIKGSVLEGFFPCGEGAGYAGGIMSAAVDGIRIGEAIIKKWYSQT